MRTPPHHRPTARPSAVRAAFTCVLLVVLGGVGPVPGSARGGTGHPRLRFAPLVYLESSPGQDGIVGYVRLGRQAPRRMPRSGSPEIRIVLTTPRDDTQPTTVTDEDSIGAQTAGKSSRACYSTSQVVPASLGAAKAGSRVLVLACVRGAAHPLRAIVRLRVRPRKPRLPSRDPALRLLGCVG